MINKKKLFAGRYTPTDNTRLVSYSSSEEEEEEEEEDDNNSFDTDDMNEISDLIVESYNLLTQEDTYLNQRDFESLLRDFRDCNEVIPFNSIILTKIEKIIEIQTARTRNIYQFEYDISIIKKFISDIVSKKLSSLNHDYIEKLLNKAENVYKLSKKFIDKFKESIAISLLVNLRDTTDNTKKRKRGDY